MHSDEYKLVARLLQEARRKSGLTQREVATRLKRPPTFPHKVEHGEREINIVELLDYCEVLGVDFTQMAADIALGIRELRQADSKETSTS